jgi:GAF domain-containing protein
MSSPAHGPASGAGPNGTSYTVVTGLVVASAVVEIALWVAFDRGTVGAGAFTLALFLISWTVVFVFGTMAARQVARLRTDIHTRADAHRATLDQVEQLEAHNEMLQTLARSTDVTLAFQALARRVARIVPCDRVGLALLKEGGHEFQTYTARVAEPERRTRPRVDLEFNMERTHIGHVVRTCEPLIVDCFADQAADFLDANVLHQTGFQSGMVLPLISKNTAVGTLNVVSRVKGAFTAEHRDALQPIAEILAVAYVAQQLQQALARFRTMEAMAELTLSIASEIQSALQTIIGHCDLLERGHPDPALQRDVAVITRQALRIQDLLERMRTAAQERLREIAEKVQTTSAERAAVSPEPTGGS